MGHRRVFARHLLIGGGDLSFSDAAPHIPSAKRVNVTTASFHFDASPAAGAPVDLKSSLEIKLVNVPRHRGRRISCEQTDGSSNNLIKPNACIWSSCAVASLLFGSQLLS